MSQLHSDPIGYDLLRRTASNVCDKCRLKGKRHPELPAKTKIHRAVVNSSSAVPLTKQTKEVTVRSDHVRLKTGPT